MQFIFPSRIAIPMRLTLPPINHDWWATQCCSWSVALIFCGQQIAWVVRSYAGQNENSAFTLAPTLLATLMLVRWRWRFDRTLHTNSVGMAILLLVTLVPYTIMSVIHIDIQLVQFVFLSIFCVYTLFIAMNRPQHFEGMPFAMMILGGTACVLAIVSAVQAPVQSAMRLGVAGTDNPLALSGIGAYATFGALVVGTSPGKNNFWLGVVAGVCFAAGLACVVLGVTRSALVAVLACVFVYIMVLRRQIGASRTPARDRSRQQWAFFGVVSLLLVFAPTLTTLAFNPQYLQVLLPFIQDHFLSTLDVLDSKTIPVEPSMVMHYYLMDYTWQHADVVGHGISHLEVFKTSGQYAHMIYIQAFYDFGLIGGFLLILTAAAVPLAIVALRVMSGNLTSAQSLVILLVLFNFVQQFSHGSPYSWQLWVPVILAYTLLLPNGSGKGKWRNIDLGGFHRLWEAFAPHVLMPPAWRTALERIVNGR